MPWDGLVRSTKRGPMVAELLHLKYTTDRLKSRAYMPPNAFHGREKLMIGVIPFVLTVDYDAALMKFAGVTGAVILVTIWVKAV